MALSCLKDSVSSSPATELGGLRRGRCAKRRAQFWSASSHQSGNLSWRFWWVGWFGGGEASFGSRETISTTREGGSGPRLATRRWGPGVGWRSHTTRLRRTASPGPSSPPPPSPPPPSGTDHPAATTCSTSASLSDLYLIINIDGIGKPALH